LQEVTLVPITEPTATSFALVIGSPMPTPPPETPVIIPTSEPLPPAPALAALASDSQTLFATDFSTTDLSDWSYDQLFWEPLPAPTWEVKNDQYVSEVLVAPENSEAFTKLNDTMAFPPVSIKDGDNVVIEVSAMPSSGEKIGLVMGDSTTKRYVLMIVGTSHARGIGTSGLTMVKLFGEGGREILYEDSLVMVSNDTWHQLRLERDGDTLRASVDSHDPVAIALPEGLTITHVGLLAGSDGYGFFDYLRVSGE
jgi:hypothetical protein